TGDSVFRSVPSGLENSVIVHSSGVRPRRQPSRHVTIHATLVQPECAPARGEGTFDTPPHTASRNRNFHSLPRILRGVCSSLRQRRKPLISLVGNLS
ncbi:MAG: hypothetical protein NT045_02785, partial [Candidatus Aureabacteria bacterium]|nr:hypothetical protein [Candidatus Auribacterota bacterium]